MFRLLKNFEEIEYIPKKKFKEKEIDGFFIANSGKFKYKNIKYLKKKK